jgi:hypothetical protein
MDVRALVVVTDVNNELLGRTVQEITAAGGFVHARFTLFYFIPAMTNSFQHRRVSSFAQILYLATGADRCHLIFLPSGGI